MSNEIEILKAENAALKKALQRIADKRYWWISIDKKKRTSDEHHVNILLIAQEALKEADHE